jgi:hypothetical protein
MMISMTMMMLVGRPPEWVQHGADDGGGGPSEAARSAMREDRRMEARTRGLIAEMEGLREQVSRLERAMAASSSSSAATAGGLG